MAKAYDYLFKLLLIGDSGVGKTSILIRFAEDNFTPTFISTIGIDFKVRTVELDGKKVKLQVWDTAGQERFRTITTAYYRGAMGIMLVYDITNAKSFESIRAWIGNINQHANAGVERMLIANKCDLTDARVITQQQGHLLAEEHKLRFAETSAKSGSNVQLAFEQLARAVKCKLDSGSASGLAPNNAGSSGANASANASATAARLGSRIRRGLSFKHSGANVKCSAL